MIYAPSNLSVSAVISTCLKCISDGVLTVLADCLKFSNPPSIGPSIPTVAETPCLVCELVPAVLFTSRVPLTLNVPFSPPSSAPSAFKSLPVFTLSVCAWNMLLVWVVCSAFSWPASPPTEVIPCGPTPTRAPRVVLSTVFVSVAPVTIKSLPASTVACSPSICVPSKIFVSRPFLMTSFSVLISVEYVSELVSRIEICSPLKVTLSEKPLSWLVIPSLCPNILNMLGSATCALFLYWVSKRRTSIDVFAPAIP